MKRLMLVRHGESEWNASRRLQGQADLALSPRGEEQARALHGTIMALAPDRVVASDLQRAVHTAALLGFPEAEKTDALREVNVGEWTGKTIDDLIDEDRKAYMDWRAGSYTPPGGEAWPDFKQRTRTAVDGLVATQASRILVVAHGGVLRALLESLLDLPPSRIVPVGPGSLTILQHAAQNDRAEARLELFNFSPTGPLLDSPD